MDVKAAFETLERIESVSSTKLKRTYLESQSENSAMESILYWTYNPFYKYGVRNFGFVDLSENAGPHPGLYKAHIFEFRDILGRLNARNITGNAALDRLYDFFLKCDTVERKWYERIISRDLRSGINVETINKTFPDLIPIFPVALADKSPQTIYPDLFCIEDKFDGYRCLTFVYGDGTVEMFSRNGKPLYGYDAIMREMSTLERGYVYDGELLSHSFKGTQSTAFRKQGGKMAEYHVFDVLPIDAFVKSTGGDILLERKRTLDKIFSKAALKYVMKVKPLYIGQYTCDADLDAIFNDAVSRGLEGVVIKDLNSMYMPGKSYSSACDDVKWFSWQKRKPRDLLDLKVVEINAGTGQFRNMMGSVTVEYPGSDGNIYYVDVGSGFNKRERKLYYDDVNLILGKTIKVATDGESSDASGALSLRFPVYKGVRSDK